MIRQLCAWCGGEIEPGTPADDPDSPSHGICPSCFEQLTGHAPPEPVPPSRASRRALAALPAALVVAALLAGCGSAHKAKGDPYPTLHRIVPDAQVQKSGDVTWVAVSDADAATPADCETIRRDVLYDRPNIGRVGVVIVHNNDPNQSEVCAQP